LAVLGADEPALAVDGVAVRVAGGLAEDGCLAVGLVPLHDPVVGDVAPHDVATGREVGGTFGPAEAGGELLDTGAALDTGVEPLVVVHETAVGGHHVFLRGGVTLRPARRRPEADSGHRVPLSPCPA